MSENRRVPFIAAMSGSCKQCKRYGITVITDEDGICTYCALGIRRETREAV